MTADSFPAMPRIVVKRPAISRRNLEGDNVTSARTDIESV